MIKYPVFNTLKKYQYKFEKYIIASRILLKMLWSLIFAFSEFFI